MTSPWSNPAVSLIVVEAGGGPFVGFFMYSGPAALGNLIDSVAPATVTADPEGNTVHPGFVSYASAARWAQLDSGALNFSPGGTAPLATLDTVLLTAATAALRVSQILWLRKATPPGIERWNPATLAAPWAAGANAPASRLNALGDLQLTGGLSGAGIVNGQLITTLAAPYFSAVNVYECPVAVTAGAGAAAAGQNFRVRLDTAGNLTFQGVAVAGAYTLSLDGACFPLSNG